MRVQRSRKRGAKMGTAIYVGRPTIWANPFSINRIGHARSVLLYGDWLEGRLNDLELERRGFCPAEIEALHRLRLQVDRRILHLREKDLACWCPKTSPWCHADILLRLANEHIAPARFFQ